MVVVQDADLEYDPRRTTASCLRPILDGKADVVYGSRFIGGDSHRVLYFWHSVGNRVLTLLSNAFTNLNLTDMETCYKVFRREIIQRHRTRGGSVRIRAGGHRQGRSPAGLPDLRGRDLLRRSDLRGGQEDRLARRLPRHVVHLEVPARGTGEPTSRDSRWGSPAARCGRTVRSGSRSEVVQYAG